MNEEHKHPQSPQLCNKIMVKHQSKILDTRYLSTFTLVFLIFSALFFIFSTAMALAKPCCQLPTGGCTDPLGSQACVDNNGTPDPNCSSPACNGLGTALELDNTGAASIETLPNPLGTTDIPTLIGNVIKALLGVTGSIALLMFIYGGILWLTSGGNEKRVGQGKSVLTWATIGLGIIFTSYILVNFVIKSLTSGGGIGNGQTSEPICRFMVCLCTNGSRQCSTGYGAYDAVCKLVCGS